MQIGNTAAIFTGRTWPGHYTLPLAVSLRNKLSMKP
jgi:hypothetical protein